MRRILRSNSMVLSLLFAVAGGGATLYVLAGASGGGDVGKEQVVVAARAVGLGSPLSSEDLTVQQTPKGAAPPDAVRDVATAQGAYSTLPMVKGELVLRSKLSSEPPGSRLAAIIPEGRVAVSVAVNDVISTGGFIAPGDRVDVLGVVSKQANEEAAIVLRDIPVLAVSNAILGASQADTADGKKRTSVTDNPRSLNTTVTLAVTIDEAKKLVQVDEVGKVRLALRQRTGSAPAALKR